MCTCHPYQISYRGTILLLQYKRFLLSPLYTFIHCICICYSSMLVILNVTGILCYLVAQEKPGYLCFNHIALRLGFVFWVGLVMLNYVQPISTKRTTIYRNKTIKHKNRTTYVVRNQCPCLGQARRCDGVKPINRFLNNTPL